MAAVFAAGAVFTEVGLLAGGNHVSHHVVRAVVVIVLVVLYGLSAPARDGGGRRDYGANDLDQPRLVVGLHAVGRRKSARHGA